VADSFLCTYRLQVSPVTAWHLWEFVAAWSPFWVLNRVMWLFISRGEYGSEVELWRLMQTFVWQSPNNCKAIWNVVTAEVPLLKRLFRKEITFKITEKRSATMDAEESKRAQTRKAIYTGLPYLFYYFVVFVSTVYVIVSGEVSGELEAV